MKKKLRLKQWVKDTLSMVFLIAVVVFATILYTNRIEKINSGQMIIQERCD